MQVAPVGVMLGSPKRLLAISFSLGLAACGGSTETDDGDGADDGSTADDVADDDGDDPSDDAADGDASDDDVGVGGLTIVSVTPADGATAVGKTAPVLILFSDD